MENSLLITFLVFLAAATVVNGLMLLAFAFVLRRRLRDQHLKMEREIAFVMQFATDADRSGKVNSRMVAQAVKRQILETQETLDSVTLLSGVVGSASLRALRHLEALERAAAEKTETGSK